LNVRLVGVTVSDTGALTVSVTITVWLVNPVAENVTVPVYVPAVRTPGEF